MFDRPIAVIDFETTGLKASESRAIEVAVVTIEAGRITDTYSSLIGSVRHIPYEITKITGIDEGMLKGAASPAQVMKKVSLQIANKVIAAHNASFDISFLIELNRTPRLQPNSFSQWERRYAKDTKYILFPLIN